MFPATSPHPPAYFKSSLHSQQLLPSAHSLAMITIRAGLSNTREKEVCIFSAGDNVVCKHLLVHGWTDQWVWNLWAQAPTVVLMDLQTAFLVNSRWLEKLVIITCAPQATYSGQGAGTTSFGRGALHPPTSLLTLCHVAMSFLDEASWPASPSETQTHVAAPDKFPSTVS